ncbi:MAG: bifunctional [glutamine synthetase] adenylyltransferase/[glutamine synthetase]-adenylyl-L-tyrosine phosphorylase [Paracoccaceae bacterium]
MTRSPRAPRSLAEAAIAAPVPFDPVLGRAVARGLDARLAQGAMGELVAGAAGSAPYLARLLERHGSWLAEAAERPPQDALDTLLAEMDRGIAAAAPAALPGILRESKARAALLIALADLGGVWSLGNVTGALTELADRAVAAAVRRLLSDAVARGRLPGLGPDALEKGAGYAVIAMGKMGARELNFSSDIDLICLFDQDRFAPDDLAEAKAAFIKITQALIRLLSDQTAEGYVFRTDLRLRPAPSTTPVCLAMETAERYYESVGRTWERAAHIKARAVAGDLAAGRAYLDRLTPFVWRRYLDFAAIEDTHEMLRKIRAKKGKFTPEGLPGHDLKLGPGGIREIEFFAQTRQLIMGGRERRLRIPTTLGALDALAGLGLIPAATAESLSADYVAHRTTEHRLQMIEDAQTQTLPKSAEARARVAALAGWSDPTAWEAEIAARLARVHRNVEAFFVSDASEAGDTAFAEEITEEGLAGQGFERPSDACRTIERWQSGALPATRNPRARALLGALAPRILRKLARAAAPDEAMAEFDRFLSGLPAGVQVFSLFRANPHLLELILEICAVAPRLAHHLGREPQTLDALLGREFFLALPDATALRTELDGWLAEQADYERMLDTVRRFAREQRFRAGVQVLRGLADEVEAGAAFSAIAEACLGALLPRVIAQFAARHGAPPGHGLAVIAMGKLGSREMTASSDLDLILVYDPGDAEASDGPRPLPILAYYPRLTQALLAALTAPTAEGRLYEVDMRLRPSGRQGPVATSLAAFERYQRERAWTWEQMALTRARVVAGHGRVAARVEAAIAETIAARAGDPAVLADAREMRTKLAEAHARDRSNPWALKHAAGGLMEIEFLAQTAVLHAGLAGCRTARSAFHRLGGGAFFGSEDARRLTETHALLQHLQQLERVALEKPFDPETSGRGLRRAMARAGGFETFAALDTRLRAALAEADAIISSSFSRR